MDSYSEKMKDLTGSIDYLMELHGKVAEGKTEDNCRTFYNQLRKTEEEMGKNAKLQVTCFRLCLVENMCQLCGNYKDKRHSSRASSRKAISEVCADIPNKLNEARDEVPNEAKEFLASPVC